MNIASYNTINIFYLQLFQSDWPNLLEDMEIFCELFTIRSIYVKTKQEVEKFIYTLLATKKAEQEVICNLLKSNWDELKNKLLANLTNRSCNIQRENVLIITSYDLLYLDFRDVCRKGYNSRIEKYIKLFAILFRISTIKLYYQNNLFYCMFEVFMER